MEKHDSSPSIKRKNRPNRSLTARFSKMHKGIRYRFYLNGSGTIHKINLSGTLSEKKCIVMPLMNNDSFIYLTIRSV